METAFFCFIGLASASLYLAWMSKDDLTSVASSMFSILFWLATMYQWNVDQVSSDSWYLITLYLAPISFNIFILYIRALSMYKIEDKYGRKY